MRFSNNFSRYSNTLICKSYVYKKLIFDIRVFFAATHLVTFFDPRLQTRND